MAFLFLLALIVAKVSKDDAQTLGGTFYVVDGDTLSLSGDRVRLKGIDAPELRQTCERDGLEWDCGEAAREALARLIEGAPILCSGRERDKYRRLLVTCRNGDADLNARMVRDGLAVAYGDYEREEAAARKGRRGLWAGEFERPQDWRKRQKGAEAEPGWFASFLCLNFDVLCRRNRGDENEAF